MIKQLQPGQTIGIIGGGQLGRMLAMAAKEAGFRIAVLEPGEDSPCGQVADIVLDAAYDDREALQQLANISDVITYEFENIDAGSLQWLTEIAYVPQGSEIIRITQDRILEKEALAASGVSIAPYRVVTDNTMLERYVYELGFPCVLKTARGGYDGKGQYVIKSKNDIALAAPLLHHGACVLEAWIPFQQEISVIITGSIDGNMEIFPIGENVHINNILHQTIVPARISTELLEKAKTLATQIAASLHLVGTLAVEMFVSGSEIYVNELAPRPHNSGHYTIEGCNISQFGQHIRAVANWPLRKPVLHQPTIMTNILGQHVAPILDMIYQYPEWSLHLYGKKEAKYQRKMGHVTVLTENIEETLSEMNDSNVWQVHN